MPPKKTTTKKTAKKPSSKKPRPVAKKAAMKKRPVGPKKAVTKKAASPMQPEAIEPQKKTIPATTASDISKPDYDEQDRQLDQLIESQSTHQKPAVESPAGELPAPSGDPLPPHDSVIDESVLDEIYDSVVDIFEGALRLGNERFLKRGLAPLDTRQRAALKSSGGKLINKYIPDLVIQNPEVFGFTLCVVSIWSKNTIPLAPEPPKTTQTTEEPIANVQ